ncbi:hypothetical protein [Bradyrhizobium sp. AZCC 2289]|uniref:hypothetical protein n=1 Tax=Bradyrhizobium sp. AZCC 2289 TaxID=3117026 RepID=UPI002FF1106C
MSENYSVEIFRQTGETFRSIHLSVDPDGSVKLDAKDMGTVVERIWGDDDYEFWTPQIGVNFTPAPTARRAQACSGDVGVEHKWQSWV